MLFEEKSEELEELIQLKKENTKLKLNFASVKHTLQ